jgi:caffeoyl-CoA O-methyltransferase
MEFLSEELEKFIQGHTEPENPILSKINRETNAKVIAPRMLSGHVQGRVLSMFSHMIKPSSILEIGTYTGYSALCLAEGLKENAKLYTIDINEELEDMVRKFFKEAGMEERIEYIIGDATELIPGINASFDLVFIDADKENYSLYYDLVFDKLNQGGYIIADNVLWSGKVTMEPEQMDKDTKAIVDFCEKVQNDQRVQNVLFPVRDGLLVVRKL